MLNSYFPFMFAILIILYFISFVVSYGGLFAYVQREYPLSANRGYREDMAMSILLSLLPGLGLFVGFFTTGFYKHGFKFW